ncbi:MAG: peptidase inhibitor family I36 protein [Nostoc sp. EfeVER01]|uniref:peptidase inhibitor family I36 protein n=1 Tax=unclassified Nostoc TaxID=2593658 RepID=UPI002AD42AC4|nr:MULTISPECIES: peptidase inhibitor family I36 protein [unclassified Nostoc]MDZ7945982.1 peptidase inhibitor family I36 protein [Nostoc sp. EfeVER01]MDZ7990745.1 peptidase inhibitor family I36 protein [Nostoc sp. EspVER01]
MSHINNQTQDLYSIELVQDLDHEAAATVSGGALRLYNGFNFQGQGKVLTGADKNLGIPPGVSGFNNKASSYWVTGLKNWIVYTGNSYNGQSKLLVAGTKGNFSGIFNDNIQSARPA